MKNARIGIIVLLGCVMVLPAYSQTRNANPQAVDLNVLVPDTVMFAKGQDNNSNWEPESTALGDGTLLVVSNTFGDPDLGGDSEVTWIVAIYPDGTVAEYPGFYGDDGEPYIQNMDSVRTDGNPPKIAGDLRPGSTRLVVANECTPYDFSAFTTDNRWTNIYTSHIFACQILELTPDGPEMITKVIDPMYGESDEELFVDKIRNGGVTILSNGNILVAAEDRSGQGVTDRDPQLSILDGETGEIIKGPFHAIGDGSRHSFWEGVTAFKDGFVVRVGDAGDKMLTFYDNEGNLQGHWALFTDPDPLADINNPNLPLDFDDNPEGYTTSITDTNRGDSIEIEASINSQYVYYAGRGPSFWTGVGSEHVYVTKIDAQTRQSVAEALVNEQIDNGEEYNNDALADRVFLAVDEADNVFVGWSDTANTGTRQVEGRFFNSDLEPVTESFLCFQSSDLGDGSAPANIPDSLETHKGSAAMAGGRLVVASWTSNFVVGDSTETTPVNTHVFTVIETPYEPVGIDEWELF